MDRSAFIRGLLDDPRDPQLPQSVPQNDFGPRAYGLLNALMPDPYVSAGEAVQQFRAGNPIDAFVTMYGAMPATGALKNVSKAAKAAETVSEAAPKRGIIAYHGSPHSFDRFDMSKIGTGEGAQAYGHGMYFAESEPVAQSYRQALQQVDTAPFDVIGIPPKDWNAARMFAQTMDPKSPDVAARDFAQWTGRDVTPELVDAFAKAKNPGSMYQVRINADPEHFLDWDKPLSEQPHVSDALRRAGALKEDGSLSFMYNETPRRGGEMYERLTSPLASRITGGDGMSAASNALREAGVPGLKYLDQGSRSAGEGSRNYVVFDDNLVEILKKYGLVGLLGGGSAMGALQSPNAQQGAPAL